MIDDREQTGKSNAPLGGDHGGTNMRGLLSILVASGALALSVAPVSAKAPCRDTHGKFAKCPEKPTKCRDTKGRFAKCGIARAR